MLKRKTAFIKNLQENLEHLQREQAKKEQLEKDLINKVNKIKQIRNQHLF